MLHNDRVSLREIQHLEVLCYNSLNLQRFVWGKNINRHFSPNFDIFSIKMTYLNALLSFLLSSCLSARSEACYVKGPLKYLLAKVRGCYSYAILLPVSQNFFRVFFGAGPSPIQVAVTFFTSLQQKIKHCLFTFLLINFLL